MRYLREGVRHRPGGAWAPLIRAGSVAGAIYVLWIGALATISGTAALWLAGHPGVEPIHGLLSAFATRARA